MSNNNERLTYKNMEIIGIDHGFGQMKTRYNTFRSGVITSMNLLSKEDADDNLMRVCSREIAEELLEITFGSDKEMQEW